MFISAPQQRDYIVGGRINDPFDQTRQLIKLRLHLGG
jgi:hypothetical protein